MAFFRSSVMDTELTMASYFLLSSPAKMPSQAVFLNTGVKPASLPAAVMYSME